MEILSKKYKKAGKVRIIQEKIKKYREENPELDDQEVCHAVVSAHEEPGLMNQISPRVFQQYSDTGRPIAFVAGVQSIASGNCRPGGGGLGARAAASAA